jgi:hypothetical protein
MDKTKALIVATYNGNYINSERICNNFFINNIKCLLENIDEKMFDKIIIVISEEEKYEYINVKYNNYLNTLKNTDKVSIVRKKNDLFLSYSSYFEGYTKHNNYDYYYFIEDDYIITNKYIEVALQELSLNNWDYIFGHINYNHNIIHACHCLCVANNKCLKVLFDDFTNKMHKINECHQINFFKIFYNSEFNGEDFSKSNYSLPFYVTTEERTLFYCNQDKEPIIFPVQMFYLNKHNYPNGKMYNYYII